MLYLLFVLTFLCGILFYGLSPHDKQLDMTAHQAEGMIVTFLAQHQAARDYLYTWLGASSDATTGNLQNAPNDKFLKAETDNPTIFNFETMMPMGIVNDMCANNQGIPGKDSCNDGGSPSEPIPGFVSKVVVDGAKHYVITYGGWEKCTGSETGSDAGCTYKRPSWWPRPGQKMRRFESWRKAIANRTRGSISCGTLVEVETNKWCIDNGETVYKNESAESKVCMTQVPTAVLNELPQKSGALDKDYADDLLFCMSEFKQGVQPGHYATSATHFYDGYSNIGIGQHKSDINSVQWTNLANDSNTLPVKFDNVPYTNLTDALDTGINLGTSYTVTILAQVLPDTGTFSLFTAQKDGSDMSIFEWEKNWTCQSSSAGFKFSHAVENEKNATCFTGYNQKEDDSKIISWTFVVANCPKDRYNTTETCMSVYENAVRRIIRKKENFNGTLKIGTSDGSANIYGIRYYNSALKEEQIQQNFKVDQKRFGISDVNNGKTEENPAITVIEKEGS